MSSQNTRVIKYFFGYTLVNGKPNPIRWSEEGCTIGGKRDIVQEHEITQWVHDDSANWDTLMRRYPYIQRDGKI
jgi:hypothetical protein